jgi:hypothetical protein
MTPADSAGERYAVVSYARAHDLVGVWNPHGQEFSRKGEPGLANGYPAEHGRFTLPLTEAYTFCGNFAFEIPRPSSRPSPNSGPKSSSQSNGGTSR